MSSSFRSLTEELLDAHAAVTVHATLMLSVEFTRRLDGHGWGRIIRLDSGQDYGGEINNLPKGAISAMTRYLALEVAPLGITVNALDPGLTDADVKHEILQMSPMERLGMLEDAARTVAFLASDDAAWITGQIIRADGGF